MKSAYYLENSNNKLAQGETSSNESESNFWQLIWHLNVPSTVKHFLWRDCNDILLTRLNLTKRKVIDGDVGPICKREMESSIHIIWPCQVAMDVWGAEITYIQKRSIEVKDVWDLWKQMLNKLTQK